MPMRARIRHAKSVNTSSRTLAAGKPITTHIPKPLNVCSKTSAPKGRLRHEHRARSCLRLRHAASNSRGEFTPVVKHRFDRFHSSIADIFEAWVRCRQTPHTQRAYRKKLHHV